VQFPIGAVLRHSNTPSLRVAGFEDEDDDEDEDEAPCEGDRFELGVTEFAGPCLLPAVRAGSPQESARAGSAHIHSVALSGRDLGYVTQG
jgi:hypothetical protein